MPRDTDGRIRRVAGETIVHTARGSISPRRRYLGDGVFADLEHGMVKLTAENGIGATDTIYLDTDTVTALLTFLEHLSDADTRGPA